MFLVVELCSSRDVVVVPECWTSSQRSSTWWPPYQSGVQLNKAVRSQEDPGEEWSNHSIRTIQVADSYYKARRKLIRVERQSPGTDGFVALRRSERLKRALSQHTEAKEGTPEPKRRRTCTTRAVGDAPRGSTAARELPPPRRSSRTHHPHQLPSPPVLRRTRHTRPPPPTQVRRSRRTRLLPPPPAPPPARRTRQSRQPPSSLTSPRLLSIIDKLHKSLNKQLRFLNVLLRLLTALKKYMMLQEILAKLPDLMEGIMDKISRMDRVPQMERIPEIVVCEIIQFVQREAEREEEEDEEDEDEEEDEEDEEDQASIIREE